MTSVGGDAYSTSSLNKFGALPYTLLAARGVGLKSSAYCLGSLVLRLRDQTTKPTIAKINNNAPTPPAMPAINAMSKPLSPGGVATISSIVRDSPVGASGKVDLLIPPDVAVDGGGFAELDD